MLLSKKLFWASSATTRLFRYGRRRPCQLMSSALIASRWLTQKPWLEMSKSMQPLPSRKTTWRKSVLITNSKLIIWKTVSQARSISCVQASRRALKSSKPPYVSALMGSRLGAFSWTALRPAYWSMKRSLTAHHLREELSSTTLLRLAKAQSRF